MATIVKTPSGTWKAVVYRNDRLEEERSASAVRLELALLGHLYYGYYFRISKAWGLGWSTNRYPSQRMMGVPFRVFHRGEGE